MVASQYGENEERKCRPTLDWTIYNTCFKGNSGVMSHETVGSWLPIVAGGGGGELEEAEGLLSESDGLFVVPLRGGKSHFECSGWSRLITLPYL